MAIQWITAACILAIGSLAALTDLKTRRLPKSLTDTQLAIAVAGTGAAAINDGTLKPVIWAVTGAIFLALIPTVMAIIGKGGFGDIPFTVAIGAAIGWRGPIALVIALIVSAIFNAILAVTRREATIPAGPGHLLGAATGLLASTF